MPEIESHAFEHGLDFKWTLPKVLPSSASAFGPLHQFADSGDIGAAQTVGASPARTAQPAHSLEEVIVDVAAAASFHSPEMRSSKLMKTEI